VVAGNAGVGKTRLGVELQRHAQSAGSLVLVGTCSHVELSLPYLPFVEAIGNHFSLTDLHQVRSSLGAAGRELAHLFPQLGLRPSRQEGDPAEAKLRLFEAIFALLRSLSAEKPLLLVIEDIHWADSSTLELLDYLHRRLGVLPLMLLTTYRKDELDREHRLNPVLRGWQRRGDVSLLDLGPLHRSDIAEMIRAIFELEAVGDELRDLLYDRCEGNPFVLEEILKAAIDQGDIFQGPAGWSRKNLAKLSLPNTVKDMILLRVERLPQGSSEVLRIAALIGDVFDAETLAKVSRHGSEVVDGVLRAALRHQLLEDDLAVPGRYRFRHALTREAILQDVAGLERRRLHGRVATVLETMPAIPKVELAKHMLAAGEGKRAVPVCLAAAAEAEQRRGYRQAADLYARTLPLIDDNVDHARALCRLGRAVFLEGDPRNALGSLVEGIRLLEASGRTDEAAVYRLLLGGCYWELSRAELARVEYEQARAALEARGPSDKLADAYVRLSHLAQGAYRWDEAIRAAERAIEIAQAVGSNGARIAAYTFLGHCLADRGSVDEGLGYLRRSAEEAEAHQLNWVAVTALAHECQILLKHYRAREAPPVIKQLQQLAESQREVSLACFFDGRHHYYLGELHEAKRKLQAGLELARQAGTRTIGRWNQLGLALVMLCMGSVDVAGKLLDAGEGTVEQQELAEFTMWRIRFPMDAGLLDQAADVGRQVITMVDWRRRLGVDEVGLLDSAVEALLSGDRREDYQALRSRLNAADIFWNDPYGQRLLGRLHLSDDDATSALACFRASAKMFSEAAYRLEEWRSRRALAVALAAVDEVRAARRELQAVIGEAESAGVGLEASCARRQLKALGEAQPPEADDVRIALERLDDPVGLAKTSLAELAALPGDPPKVADRLRTVLISSMQHLASSESPQRAEAGQLLLDYYVRRAGSHELVAERLHLSRATFYRRLRLGWELLAKRMHTSIEN
jgi:tetratricopeptide (TPR) repeat protein